MTAPTATGRRYRIILRGECRQLLADLPGEFLIETCQGWTCVRVSVRDESELYGLLDRFQDLALPIVGLNELGAGVLRPRTAVGGRPPSSRPGGTGFADWLAGAASGDPAILEPAPGPAADNIDESGLDARSHSLVRLAALVADGKPGTTYDQHIATALDHSVTLDEIVGVLVALLPVMGATPVIAAAAAIRGAIGRLTADITTSYQAHPAGLVDLRMTRERSRFSRRTYRRVSTWLQVILFVPRTVRPEILAAMWPAAIRVLAMFVSHVFSGFLARQAELHRW